MKCMICDSSTSYYFSKNYAEPYFRAVTGVEKVDYYRCDNCGFVVSKTHVDMPDDVWAELNFQFHHQHEERGLYSDINQPPYIEQALMLALLGENNIVDLSNVIDFAAGYGRLSQMLSRYFRVDLPVYDPYVVSSSAGVSYLAANELNKYKTVINSAMFEHVRSRFDLDRVYDLVSDDGCLIIHTLVCERIPNDPDWFYLNPPVHSAFHTNKSMEILMRQWGFKSSLYSPKSKCWVLFREEVDAVQDQISKINRELQQIWFYCKAGFVDYWKGF